MKKSNLFPAFLVLFAGLIIVFGNAARGAVSNCDWNSGDPHKMHWPQEPDLNPTGVTIAMTTAILADDFECSSSGPINDIHFWGSFYNDNVPRSGPGSLTFEISIYSDVPAIGDTWSRPGDLLWTRTFGPGEYSAERINIGLSDWYDRIEGSYSRQNHRYTFQYNFCMYDDFFTQEQGKIYWLVIDEIRPDNASYEFGWKSTKLDLRWNDDAVCRINKNLPWLRLTYPNVHQYKGETLDLAFVITGEQQQPEGDRDWGDAPDGAAAPGYPTLSSNNGATHLITGPWLGNDTDYPDVELNGQPELNALGDDMNSDDDEDGVSIPPLYQSQPADVTIEVNGGGGFVDAWIDFNKDMSWQDSEKIYSWFLADGVHNISFVVPGSAVTGQTFARFRISTEGSLSSEGAAKSGEVEDHQVMIYENCGLCAGQQFVRGDANQDNKINDNDVAFIFNYLFTSGPAPKCMDAADANDDGIVDMGDATYILYYLNGGPRPPMPFPDCGEDPTADTLTCDQYDYCPGCDIVRNSKWFQLPDVTNNGIDIRLDSSDGRIRTIADDFECSFKSLLTDVHLWCSWKLDVKGEIKKIHLSIHSDDPAGSLGTDRDNLFSKPESKVLWERDFLKDQFSETLYYTVPEPGENWWDPPWMSIGADKQIWRIDIDIDPNTAFLQEGSTDNPRIYWLAVRVDTEGGELGWKTRRWPDHFMDDAVMNDGAGLLPVWKELSYPSGHPYYGKGSDSIDMAFCLTYTPETPDQPTYRPVSHTQCPVAATRCPTVATRCPALETECPVVFTQCPPLETQCVSFTACPPTDTRCPATYTNCPIVATQCPTVSTRCPPEETKCPEAFTKCPFLETACYAITTCPPQDPTTICPAVLTYCPIITTQCPTEQTRCPPEETVCPQVLTKCPFLETACYAITVCPPQDPTTICPAVLTNCPIIDTQCPVSDTQCPPEETRCPPTLSQCPIVLTQCTPVVTVCPYEFTSCPSIVTVCVGQPTTCPVETQCPIVFTQCPFIESICYLCQITSLPGTEICFTSNGQEGTLSSSVVRQCPVVESTCPTVLSEDMLAVAK